MKALWSLALFPVGLALLLAWLIGLTVACHLDSISPRSAHS